MDAKEKTCANPQCQCKHPATKQYWPLDKSEADGFSIYCHDCNRDRSSAHYCNHRFDILEARYKAYHDPDQHDAKKAYFAQKRREYRAAQREAVG